MERCLARDLGNYIDTVVRVSGRVLSLRDHGKIVFIDLSDRSGEVQCFIPNSHKQFSNAQALSLESTISLVGKVKERPEKSRVDGMNGGLELIIETLNVLSHAEELPFAIESDLVIDTKFDYRPITLRTKLDQELFRFQAKLVQAFRWYLIQNEFTEFQSPSIVGGDAEGGAEVFSIDYFGRRASLATSPQLYKQMLVGAFERVFCISEAFRAEKHSTSRHLNEYTSMDFEMGYIDDHLQVMEVLEGCMRYMVQTLSDEMPGSFLQFGVEPPRIPDSPFPILKLVEAQKLLKEVYKIDCEGEPDLAPEHERKLCEHANKTFMSDFLFITHYPVEKRPMYAYEDEDDPGYTKSFDLLFKGVEISSGGQRIHHYADLKKKIQKKMPDVGLDMFTFYLQAFKYGMPPHGGMALGLERLTAKMLGLKNAKEAAVFPRDQGRIDTHLHE